MEWEDTVLNNAGAGAALVDDDGVSLLETVIIHQCQSKDEFNGEEINIKCRWW